MSNEHCPPLQFVPPLPDMSQDVSDSEEDITAELDDAVPKHSLLGSQAARHRAELAHKGQLASRQRPSLDGLKTQLSGASLGETEAEPTEDLVTVVRTVAQPAPDTAVTVTLSPSLSEVTQDTASGPESPSRSALMEELLATQRRRGSAADELPQPQSPSHKVSFQDQLKSKLEARKRSLEGGESGQYVVESSDQHHHHLPLSEAHLASRANKGDNGKLSSESITAFFSSPQTHAPCSHGQRSLPPVLARHPLPHQVLVLL